ncbi:MAG TPA: arylamine N-acetyltransferase [Blastocatellia bacterium]|nr:arylamine N-acetyltransferase [Blastocatellia bacterium]
MRPINDMDIQAYLERIKYDGGLTPSIDTLRGLHRAHMLSVPFENLDIHIQRPIRLEPGAIFHKIVELRRGGFCYELNGLFAFFLRDLGFQVEMLSAGVGRRDGAFGPEFDHMALSVRLEETWLADVGFGDSFIEPIPFQDSKPSKDPAGTFLLITQDDSRVLLKQDSDGTWQNQYRFSQQPHELADYEGMCLHHQTSPESSFTKGRVCTLATPSGRITLSGLKLIVTENGIRREQLLSGEEEYLAVLRRQFGIVLPLE